MNMMKAKRLFFMRNFFMGSLLLSGGVVQGATTVASSIKVISPNGGETIQQGANNLIRWEGVDIGQAYVYLVDNSNNRVGCIDNGIMFSGTGQQLYWDGNRVSSDCQFENGANIIVSPGLYKVLVLATDGRQDQSDAPFTISAPASIIEKLQTQIIVLSAQIQALRAQIVSLESVTADLNTRNCLIVGLADNQPASTLLPIGATRVPFTRIQFTAPWYWDTAVRSIKVQGLGASMKLLESIMLLDEQGMQYGLAKRFSSEGIVVFDTPITFRAGETKILTIVGNCVKYPRGLGGSTVSLAVIDVNPASSMLGIRFPLIGTAYVVNKSISKRK